MLTPCCLPNYSLLCVAIRFRGLASNRAQGQKRSGLDDEGWKKLTQKERELFIHDAAVARGGASNRAQGQERSGLDDEGWEKLTQKERKLFIHDAAVATEPAYTPPPPEETEQ